MPGGLGGFYYGDGPTKILTKIGLYLGLLAVIVVGICVIVIKVPDGFDFEMIVKVHVPGSKEERELASKREWLASHQRQTDDVAPPEPGSFVKPIPPMPAQHKIQMARHQFRPRYYWAEVIPQGDGLGYSALEVEKRLCVRPFNWPKVCDLSLKERKANPLKWWESIPN